MEKFKVFYDEKEDILYLGKEGEEEEVIEISPGVNAELDANGALIGLELFKASQILEDVIEPIGRKRRVA